jgi:molybdopterin synthase catalytic subunit
MELEHYPGMTEKAVEAMIDEAHRRFDILGARVVHRVGLLQPLDQIMMVAVVSAHRGQSFEACEFLMDYLKTQAPFWKKEQTPEGARWVDARVADDAALARWGISAPTPDPRCSLSPREEGASARHQSGLNPLPWMIFSHACVYVRTRPANWPCDS